MSEWSLECDVWESKFSENNNEPSIRHAYAAGWNRHKEIHSKAAQKKDETPGTIDNTARDAISLLAEFYEYWEDNYAASPDFYEKVRKMCGIAKRHP